MSMLIHAPITASLMLTVTAICAAVFLKTVRVRTPRLRQFVLLGVLLQGLMLFRLPVELPLLTPIEPAISQRSASATSSDQSLVGNETDLDEVIPAFAMPISSTVGPVDPTLQSHTFDSPIESGSTRSLILCLGVVWFAGFSWVIFRAAFSYVRLCFLVRRLPVADADWSLEWSELCRSRNKPAPQMLVSETVGPMLMRRPVGYTFVVPGDYWASLSNNQRRGVMLHELGHLCRHDVWRQIVVRSIASLHWWNPASWWCVRRYEECTEWACDEWLTKDDPEAARGLAASLVKLLEFIDAKVPPTAKLVSGVGVQSMAAPPLTERVNRLLKPSDSGDSTMKRLLFASLAAGLLTLSIVQFQLVAAPPQQESVIDEESSLNVLSLEASQQLVALKQRLNRADATTKMLSDLLETDAGQIALAGALERLEDRHRDTARADAVPNFVASHFEETDDGKLKLRAEYAALAGDWVNRSRKFGETLNLLSEKMRSIAGRIVSDRDIDQLVKRMLTDEHAALVITMDEFDGQVDPIERFLGEAFEELLVKRGEKMIVIPTLDERRTKKIAEFEKANEIFELLRPELQHYAQEYATPDESHKQLVAAMQSSAFVAVISMELANEEDFSASAAVDKMIDNLEDASRDTPEGLVIHDKEAWQHIERLLEVSERATERHDDVRASMKKIAAKLDLDDPMTVRFSKQLESSVLAHFVAAEIPYAELDLAEHLEQLISNVMEPVDGNQLRVQEDAAAHVTERAREILSGCRRIRRFIRQINGVVERFEDQGLANDLGESGRLVLLADIREFVEHGGPHPIEILEKELFESTSGGPTSNLTVRADRADVIGELAERSKELKEELANDDF